MTTSKLHTCHCVAVEGDIQINGRQAREVIYTMIQAKSPLTLAMMAQLLDELPEGSPHPRAVKFIIRVEPLD